MPAPIPSTVVDVTAALLDNDSKVLRELAEDAAATGSAAQALAIRLACHIAEGDFLAVFADHTVRHILGTDNVEQLTNLEELRACVLERQRTYAEVGEESEREWRATVCVLIGATCVNAFVQNGVTGPPLDQPWTSLLPESLKAHSEDINRDVVRALGMDGEECYRLADSPYYVYLAHLLLMLAPQPVLDLAGGKWWRARYCHVHQQLLSDWSNTLYTTYREAMDAVLEGLQEFPAAHKARLLIRANMEYGIMGFYYQDIAREMDHVVTAQKLSGLVLEMTGALGRRTRWQTFDTPQLVLKAKSEIDVPTGASIEEANKPTNMKLNDDTLLEEIAFTEKVEDQADLAVLDQCIILASCLNVKNSNPKHGLTTEQMMPFVERVLKETNNTHNWLVYSMGLLLRSRLESERSRTVERGVLQMQVLLDQYKDERGRGEATVAQRMEYVYCLAFPTYFNLQRELGQRYAGIGVLRSAQEIYERLEMWEDVISCHLSMGEEQKALKLCNQLLANEKTARLLCVLGDITKDKSKYQEAWELSGEKYTRAMRSLGMALLREGDAAGCVECLKKATAINPLQEGTWFTMGCAALQTDDWNTAVTAFRRCLTLNEENGEAWNNLGSAYIKLGDSARAAHALQQALKYSFDNWKMWENYLNVTTDVKDIHNAMRAIHRLIEIRPQKFSDVVAVKVNLLSVMERIEAAEDDSTKESLTKRWGEVMGRCQAVMSQNADLWEVCAQWYRFKGDAERVTDCLQKAYRVSMKSGWEKEQTTFEQVGERALALTDEYFKQGTSSGAHSAKLMLRSLVKKTETDFGATELHAKLRQVLEEAEAMETRLKA